MKKRLMCITLAFLMICSLLLVSCSKRTEEEIIDGIVNSGSTALTLSIWIPTDSDTSSPEFQSRLEKVEQAINDILDEKNESTRIKLVAVNDDEYEKKLAERFSSMKDEISKNGGVTAVMTADKYVNKAEKIFFDNGSYMYELAYPEILETQLDILLVRGYDEYISNVSAGNLRDLDSYLFADSSRYLILSKMVLKNVFDQLKVSGKTYGIPNNHLYGDEYQYILVNKDLLASYDGLDADEIENIFSCEDFIKFIGGKNESGIVPFVASPDDVANFFYFSSGEGQALIGSDYKDPSSVFLNEAYNSYVSFYKRLNDLSYVKSELGEGEKAAVMVFYGTNTDVAEYEDEYFAIKSDNPMAYEDDVFASIFAISSYSANYDRSMRILYLLQSNEQIRTLLQYGISGEDYDIELDENGNKKIVVNPESEYKMNVLYTGNGYTTYPGDGLTIEDWESVKEMNHDTVISPYFHLVTAFKKLSNEDQNKLKTSLKGLKTLSEEIFEEINSYTAEQYESFCNDFAAASDIDIADVEKNIAEYEEKIASETDEGEKAKLEEKLSAQNELKETYYKNSIVVKILSSEQYQTAIELSLKLYELL